MTRSFHRFNKKYSCIYSANTFAIFNLNSRNQVFGYMKEMLNAYTKATCLTRDLHFRSFKNNIYAFFDNYDNDKTTFITLTFYNCIKYTYE